LTLPARLRRTDDAVQRYAAGVNGTTATHAVVIAPSGRTAFDESALLAARNATYPLVATTCSPLPTAYLWRTTFAYQIFP